MSDTGDAIQSALVFALDGVEWILNLFNDEAAFKLVAADLGLDPLMERSSSEFGVVDLALFSINAFMAGVSDDGVKLRHLKNETRSLNDIVLK